MICPIMTRNIVHQELDKNNDVTPWQRIDLIKQDCLGKDCALWVVAGFTSEGKTIEHCGLVK